MKIYGIGTDIANISRINKSIKNKKFITKLFHKNEIEKCARVKNVASCYAKRFAAKEAFSKALGTGFRKGVYWKDLEVINLPSGKPSMNFYGESKKHLDSLMPKNSVPSINLSITDEFPYAQAIVTINADDL